jgi:Protein of unknown function (DUF4231)
MDGPEPVTSGAAWERLEDQLRWYEERSAHDKVWYQSLKVTQIVTAAAIPVVAGLGAKASVAGALGAVVVVLEALQQLFQFQQNWIGYRGTAEALRREQQLYISQAGPYTGAPRPAALLAERVEDIVAAEHTAWSAHMQTSETPGRRTT